MTLFTKSDIIIDFDSCVKNVHNLTPDDSITNLTFEGYGGTNLVPPFEKALDISPDLFIVFSDLGCVPYTEVTPFPTLWVVVNNLHTTVSFGTRIDMEIAA